MTNLEQEFFDKIQKETSIPELKKMNKEFNSLRAKSSGEIESIDSKIENLDRQIEKLNLQKLQYKVNFEGIHDIEYEIAYRIGYLALKEIN